MRIVDEKLLDRFRTAGKCEWCGQWFGCREPHHVFARGMGSGSRLDIRINLAALCLWCHRSHHDGNRPLRCDLLAVVAKREGLLQADVEAEIRRLIRAPKARRV